jgi:Flp pilus assembly pilin Flp
MLLATMRFLKNTAAATAIEYGLVALLISVAIIVGLMATRAQVQAMYQHVVEATDAAGMN